MLQRNHLIVWKIPLCTDYSKKLSVNGVKHLKLLPAATKQEEIPDNHNLTTEKSDF